jgi:cob(I)alamin adenosyltransferase
MVRLSKIYTKVGDKGETMLGDGKLVPKHSPRVEAYGAVDEANSAIGLAITHCPDTEAGRGMADALTAIQHDLFDVGADLCTPIAQGEPPGKRLRVVAAQRRRLEPLIDGFNAPLAPLNSFVLPGGTRLAAQLHAARTVTRRAERAVAALLASEPAATNPEALVYLNRLSDLLFVLARVANQPETAGGAGDVLWRPGANRPGAP